MNGPSPIQRPWLSGAALVAAAALAVKGAQEWHGGTGWPLLLIAGAMVAAVLVRQLFFRR